MTAAGRVLFQRLTTSCYRCNCRSISFTTKKRSSYDADGKTSVTILNTQPGLGLMIDTYSKIGFRLNNGSFILGPIAIFPKTVMSWNVENDTEINNDSLEMFTVLEPGLDLLLVGFGAHESKREVSKFLHTWRVKKKMNVEVLPTEHAVSTFNFLNAEGRFVAAALIPPTRVLFTEDDIAQTRDKMKKLYEMDD